MKKLTIAILMMLPVVTVAQELSDADMKAMRLLPEFRQQNTPESIPPINSFKLNNITVEPKSTSKGDIRPKLLNLDPAKIEALKGTYTISYKLSTDSYTDKIVINDIYTDTDGEVMGTGLYYEDQAGSGQFIFCQYGLNFLANLNSDYICTTYDGFLYQDFAFRFSGNTINSGYYGIGFSADSTLTSLKSKVYPITGSRSTATTSSAQDEYVSLTGVLTLPTVKVGTDYYSAILVYEGNDRFRLQSATKTTLTSANQDVYVAQTGKLTLPNVKSGTDYFSVVMGDVGNSRFSLQSVVKK